MPLTAQVALRKGVPTLLVNGKPVPPLMLFVNLVGEKREAGLRTIRRAAQAGVHIVSFVVHFFPWTPPGETPNYRPFEEQMDAILKENPHALLLPRFGLTYMPDWWAKQHPDEMMLYDNGERGYVSMASEKWRVEAGDVLCQLVRHLESRYGDHILGYHPCGQNTGEWFYDRVWEGLLPGFERPMEIAFRRYLRDRNATLPTAEERKAKGKGVFLHPATQRRLYRFWRFQQEVMVEPLEEFARIIKEETDGRKLVVLFYGYTFELSGLPGGPAVSGHLALERLLKCPHVDILCSPISYFDRQASGAGGFMAPVDSVQLHGKLWLNEDDTRTYLSKPEDNYGRAETPAETLSVHRRNFAHIVTRGAACWWMDLMGAGWLDSAEIWDNLAKLVKIYEQILPDRTPYQPEIAVVVDEASLCHLSYGNAVTLPLLSRMRYTLYRIGTPLGFYLLGDVCSGKVEHAKMYLVLNAFAPTEAQRRALKALIRKGKMVVWFYAPGYIRGNSASADNISDLTGIRVVEREEIPLGVAYTGPAATVRRAGVDIWQREEFGVRALLSPGFVVQDASARTLATFVATSEVAVAMKGIERGWSVYFGTLHAGVNLLQGLAKKAGVHLYGSYKEEVVSAGNRIVSLHATQQSDWETYVHLPDLSTVYDPISGEVVDRRVMSLKIQLQKGETRLLQML
ncbi:MAG: hypothetical protein ACP5RN_13075 [Armatimonadota bacterium]